MDVTIKQYSFTITHRWFDASWDMNGYPGIDIINYYGVSDDELNKIDEAHPLRCYKQNSLITDLNMDRDAIFQNFKKNTRYEIRRSRKDDIDIKFYINSIPCDIVKLFIITYNNMYKSKNMNTRINTRLLDAYINQNAIAFTVGYLHDNPTVFHTYVIGNDNVRLFHSCSLFRNNVEEQEIIGRLNKRLHWEDMILFKEKGISRYDWGGINDFDHPDGIARFKMQFGGSGVTYNNFRIPISFLGLIYLRLKS